VRKAIAIFLLVLLPLQWGWAMAASYCEHEAAGHGAHFGHHEHSHADVSVPGDAGTADGPVADTAGFDASGHADCGTCQLSSASVLMQRLSFGLPATGDTLPDNVGVLRPDAHPESLYRPPLLAAA
jgi:hypothetical protein